MTRTIYTVGGNVQSEDGLYIQRQADAVLLDHCLNGRYAHVLTSRQLGKSSLMEEAAQQLSDHQVTPILIDLSIIGKTQSAGEWHKSVVLMMEERAYLSSDAYEWWEEHQGLTPSHRFALFMKDVLLKELDGPVVVFFDEIDTTVDLDFSDDFFAAIRAFYNRRAREPEFKRLSFVLIGTATPAELIREASRTPFNIGSEVVLEDFTPEEAAPLAGGLGLPQHHATQVLGWILKWTGGHPYLTQKFCVQVLKEGKTHWTEDDVDDLARACFFSSDSPSDFNLQWVQNRVLNDGHRSENLRLHRRILRRSVSGDERSPVQTRLRLAGLARLESGRLVTRNLIYRQAFNEDWVKKNWTIDWRKILQKVAVVFLPGIFLVLLGFLVLQQRVELSQERKLRQEASTARVEEERQRKRAEDAEAVAVLEANKARAETEKAVDAMNRETEAKREADAQRLIAETNEALAKRREREAQAALQREAVALKIAELEREAFRKLSEDMDAEAVSLFNQSLAYLPEEQGFKKAETLMIIGDVFRNLGRFDQADQYYERALPFAQELTSPVRADLFRKVGDVNLALDRYPATLSWYEKALGETDGEGETLRRAHLGLARVQYRQGRYQEALTHLEAARNDAGPQHQSDLTYVLGQALLHRGDFHELSKLLDQFENHYPEPTDYKGDPRLLNLMGVISRNMAHTEKALTYHREALALARHLGGRQTRKRELYRETEKQALFALCELHHEVGAVDQVLTLKQRYPEEENENALGSAYALAEDKVRRARLILMAEENGKTRQRLREAEGMLLEAMEIQQDLGAASALPQTMMSLAEIHTRLSQRKKAEQVLNEALVVARTTGGRLGETRILLELADFYNDRERKDQARMVLADVLQTSRDMGDATTEIEALLMSGDIASGAVRLEQARVYYEQARLRYEDLLTRAGHLDLRWLSVKAAPAYHAEIKTLMALNQKENAFLLAERGRAYTLLGRYSKQARILPFLQDQQKDNLEKDNLIEHLEGSISLAQLTAQLPARVLDVSQKLEADQAVISYYVLDDRVLAFLIDTDGLTVGEVPRKERDLLYKNLMPPASANILYTKLLMDPFGERLSRYRQIGLVPHDLLLNIPVHITKKWRHFINTNGPGPQFHNFASSTQVSFEKEPVSEISKSVEPKSKILKALSMGAGAGGLLGLVIVESNGDDRESSPIKR